MRRLRIGFSYKHLRHQGIVVRLFITCWIVFVLHFATNISREIYPAITLGDHLSFDVSEYVGLHPDIFEIQGRGAYINNNPGASILGAIPYAIARPLINFVSAKVQDARASDPNFTHKEYDTVLHPNSKRFYKEALERGLDVKFGLAAGFIQAFCMAPLSALAAVVMFYILLAMTRSIRLAILLSLLFAFATPVFYRTAFLNHNVLLAHFSLFSFALLWRPWVDSDQTRSFPYLAAGLLCGWTVVLDYSGIVAVFSISIYAVLRYISLPKESKSIQHLMLFFVGIALCGSVLMAYQWFNFGHPLYPAQHYMPHTEFSQSGYHGMTLPKLHLLFETAFSRRYGLFTSAPILLLVFCLPFFLRDIIQRIGGNQLMFILVYGCGFFLFCSANQFGYVQFNTGVRHIVPVTPFLFLIVAMIIIRMPKVLAVIFSAVSLYWSWCLAMYRDVEFGLGIPEALIHITFNGFQLPWLTTLQRLGYIRGPIPLMIVLSLSTVVILFIWRIRWFQKDDSDNGLSLLY
jgi:hypothetical protein